MPSCTVKLFAQARDAAGTPEIRYDFEPGAQLETLKTNLVEQFPELHRIVPHCTFAIDREYVAANAELIDGAEVACIPPVSGG